MAEPGTSRKDPTLSAVAIRKLGRYELLTQIGKGGMAEVHLAMQRGSGGFEKLVVIKLVHSHLADKQGFVQMLLDEGRLAGMIKHANVVDIYDLGEADGQYYVAMEYLDGEPLLAVLREGVNGQRLDPLSTARVISDAAEGLEAAHRLKSLDGKPLGLVHHDVSLGNIVVLYNGQVKLVDFGVAKAKTSTAANLVQGKFAYMAPEKLREGASVDRRSDIWSLGVVAWEALTLQRLFKGGDADTMQQVLEREIPVPSSVNPEVPALLDPIIMRALEREPEKRLSTAKGFSLDLESALRKLGYASKNDRIASYMETTFQKQIAVRQRLVSELAAGRTSREAIEAFRKAARNDGSGATPVSGVPVQSGAEGSQGTPAPALPPFDPENPPEPPSVAKKDSLEDIQGWLDSERRRKALGWRRYAPFIAGGAVVLLLIIILASRCGGGADKAATPDAALVAAIDAAVAPALDAAPVKLAPDAAPEPAPDNGSGSQAPPQTMQQTKPQQTTTQQTKPQQTTTQQTKPQQTTQQTKPQQTTTQQTRPPPPSGNADQLFRAGMDQLRRGDAKGAQDTFTRATKLNSAYAPAWYGLGRANEALGMRRGPVKSAYSRYLSLDPKGAYAADARKRIDDL